MTRYSRIVVLSVLVFTIASSVANGRKWTDRTGRQVEAEFIGSKDGNVTLKRLSDGKTFRVPLNQFSDADQEFVAKRIDESSRQRSPSEPRKIPLVMQKVFLPGFSEEKIAKEKVRARFDEKAEYVPDDDVVATMPSAKMAAWSAGYEFTPIETVKKGETPSATIARLATDSDIVVLIRVSTRTANFGSAAIISVFADATLYNRKTREPLSDASIMALQKIDPKQIEGDNVRGEYWVKTVASTFRRRFDQKFLSEMQRTLDGAAIDAEIEAIRESPNRKSMSPTVEELDGGDERDPELTIALGPNHKRGTAYLLAEDESYKRKWLLGAAAKDVDFYINPGRYTLYFVIPGATTPQTYVDQVMIDFKKRYSYKLEN